MIIQRETYWRKMLLIILIITIAIVGGVLHNYLKSQTYIPDISDVEIHETSKTDCRSDTSSCHIEYSREFILEPHYNIKVSAIWYNIALGYHAGYYVSDSINQKQETSP